MKKYNWKKVISGAMVAVMLAGSLSDFQSKAAKEPDAVEAWGKTMDGADDTEAWGMSPGRADIAQAGVYTLDGADAAEDWGISTYEADVTDIGKLTLADKAEGFAQTGDGGDTQQGTTDGGTHDGRDEDRARIRLRSLTSPVQGYDEIVLKLAAVKNASDGTDTEDVYYEIMVSADPKEGETVPAGCTLIPRYYYLPKAKGVNTQIKGIRVNDGDLSAPTACTYQFSVRMVLIDKNEAVPDEDTPVEAPVNINLAGNTITKNFSTKNLYYEDNLKFSKKSAKIFAGQEDLFAGFVKYSKKASYIHDLTAVAYDSRGGVCDGITCAFRNDNDELYVSADYKVVPGKYKVVVYAGIGEAATAGEPQSGTMYQSNTSFALTVQPGIYRIDTDNITAQAAVRKKDTVFSAVPVGYGYYDNQKAKSQKFTYEIKSAVPDESGTGFTVTEPSDKVRKNVSVSKKGKVTVKKGYYVDPDIRKNYIAVIIKAADYEGNEAEAAAYVQLVDTVMIPRQIYLTDSKGKKLGTKLSADKANGANVVVLDQNGNDISKYVTLTPADNAKGTAKAYVTRSQSGKFPQLFVRMPSKITIKATTRDGGKQSKTLKITVSPPTFTLGAYWIHSITSDGFRVNNADIKRANGLVTYSAPRGAVIKFQQGIEIKGKKYFNDWYEWEYELKGGKLKVDGKYWLITPTKQITELKVWTKTDSTKTWTVKFKNTGWNKVYELAPAVKLLNGKLYSNKYTNLSDVGEYDENGNRYIPNQQLVYQYGEGDYDSVQIARVSKAGPELYMSDFDSELRTFKLNLEPGNDIKAGKYQYKLAFYKEGKLMCKPATLMIRVNKASPVKLNPAYTWDTAEEDYIVLRGTPYEFTPDFSTNLMNANVGGRANDFNKYFKLDYITDSLTGETNAVILFKETVTDEEREKLKGRSFTGYVGYSYYYGYSYIKNATSKITIKII